MTARNRQTGDRRPDVIRTRRQALAALRRVKAERKKRKPSEPAVESGDAVPLGSPAPPGHVGQGKAG